MAEIPPAHFPVDGDRRQFYATCLRNQEIDVTEQMEIPNVGIEALEIQAGDSTERAAEIYREYGALVVRGLLADSVEEVRRDIEAAAQDAIAMVDRAKKVTGGWNTPDGTLWLPAPEGFERDKQIMVLGCLYKTSAALFRSAIHPRTVELVREILGPNVELFMDGQVLYKEPVGGHPKLLHQDVSYFQHKYEGPCGILNYAADTSVRKGALHVVPGSHKWGVLNHVDTFSHLGLDPSIWTFEKAVAIEGKAGDSIFFHVNTIHGSPENLTDTARPAFIHRYRRADDYVVINASNTADREAAAKQIEQAKKENQQGYMVCGRRVEELF